jgi:membrane AbrB-like protein
MFKKEYYKAFLLLLLLSLIFSSILRFLGFPSPLLIGSMIAGVIIGVKGQSFKINDNLFNCFQSLLGFYIGSSIDYNIINQIIDSWHIFFSGTLWSLLVSFIIGYILTKLKKFPGSTAIWGVSPGAASAMVLMSQDYGGDLRLVAFMQYSRVLLVSLFAVIVSKFLSVNSEVISNNSNFFDKIYLIDIFLMFIAFFISVLLSKIIHIPGGQILIPLTFCFLLNNIFKLNIKVPVLLLLLCYICIGWGIGLKFDKQILNKAIKLLPTICLSMILLIIFCAIFAFIIASIGTTDIMTAYLATSPGGIDTIAIIAVETKSDIGFVLAMQTFRMFLVFFISPILSKFVVKLI